MAMQDVLTTRENEEAQALLKRVLDTGGEVLLPPGQWLLLARYAARLSPPTPEDVARAASTVNEWLDTSEAPSTVCAAVEALRDGAARVPGLEERLAEARSERHNMEKDLAQRTRERDSEMEERFKVTEVKNRQTQRADAAESERDAALKREEAVSDHLQMMGVSSMETLADDFARLQKERDDARQEVEKQEEETAALRRRLENARLDGERTEGEAAVLRERVVTLERELGDLRHFHGKFILDGSKTINEAESRAEAAERRVAEYGAAARYLDAHLDLRTLWGKGDLGVKDPSGINAVFAKFRGLLGMDGETYERETPSTHHAPAGLLEAVGHVLNLAASPFNGGATTWSNAVDALRAAYDAAKGGRPAQVAHGLALAGDPCARVTVFYEDGTSEVVTGARLEVLDATERRVRVLPDAAKGGEVVPLAQDVATVREALEALAEAAPKPWHTSAAQVAGVALGRIATALGLDTPPSGPGGGESLDASGPEHVCGEEGTECAKCLRPGLESSALTPESLAAVVEEECRDWARMAASGVVGKLRYLGRIDGAREVLRRVLGGRVPRVYTEAQVRSAFQVFPGGDRAECPQWGPDDFREAIHAAREALGLTRPSETTPAQSEGKE
jgi:hypothetical protein